MNLLLASALLLVQETRCELSLVEEEGSWVFRVSGATDLPAGTVLQAQLCALSADELRRTLEEHDRALADFKRFAGLD